MYNIDRDLFNRVQTDLEEYLQSHAEDHNGAENYIHLCIVCTSGMGGFIGRCSNLLKTVPANYNNYLMASLVAIRAHISKYVLYYKLPSELAVTDIYKATDAIRDALSQ